MTWVLEHLPDARLIIIGGRPQCAQLEQEARDLGIVEHVSFLRERPDAPERLSEFDVFVLSSLDEGVPNAALEAMVAGVPVIGTSVGGVPDMVDDDESGFVVPPGSADALANAMIALGKDSELREHFSR